MDSDDYPDRRFRREPPRPPRYMNDDERVRRPSYYTRGGDYSTSESDLDIRIIPRGRPVYTTPFSRDRPQSLNERRYTVRSPYSPRSRSRIHFRGRSPSPLRHRWDYEEPAPPIPLNINSSRTHLHNCPLEYIPPVDKDGNPLNLDVNLVSSTKDENGPGWSNRRSEFASQRPESLSLEASRGFADDTETEKIVLTLNSESNPDKSENLRWIHLQQDYMSIKSLENLITQTPDLNNDNMLIALRLLQQVAEKSETPYVHGHYLKSTVLRGDCHSTGKVTAPQGDRHCTFISFPYFSFQTPFAIPGQKNAHLHPTRGLLQTVHLLESTKFRDSEQAICKLSRPNRFGKFIHVPQVWSIAIGSDLLITYSTMSMHDMRGENIEIQKPLARELPGPSVLRVRDPYQRVFFFSMDLCKTWFELEELICTQCGLGPREYVKNEFRILLKDKKPVAGAEWPAIVASEKSLFIDIFVYLKDDLESDESEFDGDDYLQRESRSKFGRDDSIYPHARETPRRRTQSGRTSLHFVTESLRQSQRTSTGGTRPETVQSTWPHTYDESYPFPKRTYIPKATGSATIEERRTGVRRANQPNSQDETNNNDPQPTLSDTKDESNARFNATKRQTLVQETSNVTFFIEGEQNIVAEPDTYYSSSESERERDQSFPSDNNTALALFDGDQGLGGIEPALHRFRPSHTRLHEARSLPHMRRPSSRSRRPSTSNEYYKDIDARFHHPLGSQSSAFANNYHSSTRQRRAVDIRPSLEDERYFEPRHSRRHSRHHDNDQSLGRGYTPPLHLHRRHYGRYSAHGIANSTTDVASMNDGEIEADIYYIPKKKKVSIPIVNISGGNKVSCDEEFASRETNESSRKRSYLEHSQREFTLPERSSASSLRERPSRSSNSSYPALPAKSFALPILMWPTGPAEDPGETKNHHHSPKDNMEGPPRTRNPDGNAILDQDSDASLAEVLDRVYSSLLTDKSSNHDLIFRQMEIAHQKDATFKIPKREIPASEAAINTVELGAGSQGGNTKYDPMEGLLDAKPTKDAMNDEVQVPEYQTKLLQFSTTANSLLECFVPADYSSPVTWRYYGSIKKIINTVDESQKHNAISQLYANQSAVWLVEDISDPEYLEKHHLQPLSKPLQSCLKCREKFPYKNEIDASHHLLKDHFPSDKLPSVATAMLWVRKHQPLSDVRRCDQHLSILRICCLHLDDIHKCVQEIRDGVCSTGVVHNPRYRLPKALVVAFRKLILYLVYMSHVIDLINSCSEIWTSPNWMPGYDRELNDKIMKLTYIGMGIEDAVDQGKIDLTVMLRTQDYTQSIKRYEAVGPQYILIMVLSNLQYGVDCKDLVEVYKEYIARLSFQVSQYPRRRLLRSLKYVEEEIMAIHRIMTEQHNLYAYFGRVLNPMSFRNTTETRKSMYELEMDLIDRCCFKSNQHLASLEQLIRRVQRLTDDTKTSVEINDDDHGKAILVFTIVTLVFLPLSFVASFLGMNTVDIRDQTSDQSLYWMIAVPVTAGVVVLALAIGYKYEAMRDYVERYMGKVKRE